MVRAVPWFDAVKHSANFRPAVGTVLIMLLLAVLYYGLRIDQLLDRSDPIQFVGGEVRPSVAAPSENIQLIRYAIVRRPCPGFTYRQIRDGKGYVHLLDVTPTLSVSTIPRGEVEHLVGRSFALPDAIASGQAVFRSSIVYTCPWLGVPNPLHRLWPITVYLPDLPFVVR